MESNLEKDFFELVVKAISEEESILNELFEKNSNEYQKFLPCGVSCLFETGYVYIIFKKLLDEKFPLLVSWEHKYTNSNKRADMVLLNSSNQDDINSFIEFKKWKFDDGHEIDNDIGKLEQEKRKIDKYIVAIECNYFDKNYDELINKNAEFLEKKGLKIIDKKYIKTMFYNYKDKTNELVPLNIYFCNLEKKDEKGQ